VKAGVLFLMRLTTGLLLVIWGAIKLNAPETAISVSNTYYKGALSAEAMQMPLGAAQILLGVLVVLGVFRNIIYPIQAIVLGLGVAAIWQHILDPLGLYLVEESARRTLFFPSSTVFAASLAMVAFREYDSFSLGAILKR